MEFILIILSSVLFTIPYYYPALFFLSFFAFIPLIHLVRNYDYSHSFIIALLVGFLNSVFTLYWLYQPLTGALKMPFSFNVFILFLYFIISALILAVWVMINKFLQPKYSYSPFIAALSWSVLEYFRFEYFNFNPFNYFAYTQSSFNLIAQYAAYGGLFLVSFLAVLIASYLVKIYLDPGWKKAIPLLLIFIILIILPFFIEQSSEEDIKYQNAEIVIVNSKIKNNLFKKIEQEINSLASLIKNSESKYIFTAENSISFDLIRNNYYRDQLKSSLKTSLGNSYIQLGSQAAAAESYDAKIFNSLFLLNNDFEIINRSDKKRNILSGLNFPYKKEIIYFLADYLSFSQNLLKFSEADKIVKVEDISYLNLFSDEVFIPLVAKKNNNIQDLNLIVNSAEEEKINSEVYSNLSFAAGVYRAIESKTALIRAVNGGYSAYINEQGKILMKKKLEGGSETVNIALTKQHSYYQRNPKVVINIIILVFLFIVLVKIIIFSKNKLSSRN